MFTAFTSIARNFSVAAQTYIFLAFALASSFENQDVFCFGFVSTQTPALKRNCDQTGFVCCSLLPVSKPRGHVALFYSWICFPELISAEIRVINATIPIPLASFIGVSRM